MVLKKNKLKSIFIQNFTKKGKKELVEKKVKKLFFNLKKQLKQNPNYILNKSLNNLKMPLHVDKKIRVLSKIDQLKYGIKHLKLNDQLLNNIVNNFDKVETSIQKNKTTLYNEAIKLKYNKQTRK